MKRVSAARAAALGGVSLNASLSCSVTQQLGSPQLLFIRRNLHLILYLAKLAKLSYAQLRITLYMLVSFIKKISIILLLCGGLYVWTLRAALHVARSSRS
jgi:hypothetical protein